MAIILTIIHYLIWPLYYLCILPYTAIILTTIYYVYDNLLPQDFHLDQLEAAKKKLASIRGSRSLPPVMEEKMAEVNKRWEELVKHAGERLSRLEPIVSIVKQFDAVKDPLNEWFSHKSDYFNSLPPLEVELLPTQQQEMEDFIRAMLERANDVSLLEELAEKFCKEIEVSGVAAP